jgi:gluconate 2-dehydrogenase gamma chain
MTASLTDRERAFLTAAVDTMIPGDRLSPSGSDCGVVNFIERELAGPYGVGARLYRNGPFLTGKAEHGYQLNLTPRELIAAGISAANVWTCQTYGKDFAQLDADDRIIALQAIEGGTANFPDFSSRDFFETLLGLTMEGFFADPIHGGNRDCASWKMIGYPGQPANYRDVIESNSGKRLDLPPRGIADMK